MASASWAAEGVPQHGPSHCWVAFFLLPWSHCIGTMSGAAPAGRLVVSNNWSIANAPYPHCTTFWYHVSEPPGEWQLYFFSQIHSELHSQTFRHLVKGGYDSGGVTRVAWTFQQHPANTRSRWSTHFCRENDNLARGHLSGTSSSF